MRLDPYGVRVQVLGSGGRTMGSKVGLPFSSVAFWVVGSYLPNHFKKAPNKNDLPNRFTKRMKREKENYNKNNVNKDLFVNEPTIFKCVSLRLDQSKWREI